MQTTKKTAKSAGSTKNSKIGSTNGSSNFPTAQSYAKRRKEFVSKLLPDSVAFIVSNPEQLRTNDTEYPYRQSSDILYLTNFPEPESVLVLSNVKGKPAFSMLVRPKDKTREIWTGKRFGPDGAKRDFQAEEAATIDQFSTALKDWLSKAENVYYKFGRNQELDHVFNAEWLKMSRPILNPEDVAHSMRLVKSPEELVLMRKAAGISAEAHCKAMEICKPGMSEYQIQAQLEMVFRERGASGPAYTSIVAGGENAVILHYIENSKKLVDGDLLLIDAACEYDGYASDITRTFPVNGKFSKPQLEIYEVVLDAQIAAIKKGKPGVTLFDLHHESSNKLREGLIDLGILDKSMATAESETKALEKRKKKNGGDQPLVLRDLFMHGTSHWLGLDVHDVGTSGTRSTLAKSLPMEPGMVFTVEPGLYFDPDDKRLPKKYRGIGIRIEDDVVITKKGCEVLTAGVPKHADEIEALMSSGRS